MGNALIEIDAYVGPLLDGNNRALLHCTVLPPLLSRAG